MTSSKTCYVFKSEPVQPRSQRIAAEAWETHRQDITREYLFGGLPHLVSWMQRHHRFFATSKQYEYRLHTVWNISRDERRNFANRHWLPSNPSPPSDEQMRRKHSAQNLRRFQGGRENVTNNEGRSRKKTSNLQRNGLTSSRSLKSTVNMRTTAWHEQGEQCTRKRKASRSLQSIEHLHKKPELLDQDTGTQESEALDRERQVLAELSPNNMSTKNEPVESTNDTRHSSLNEASMLIFGYETQSSHSASVIGYGTNRPHPSLRIGNDSSLVVDVSLPVALYSLGDIKKVKDAADMIFSLGCFEIAFPLYRYVWERIINFQEEFETPESHWIERSVAIACVRSAVIDPHLDDVRALLERMFRRNPEDRVGCEARATSLYTLLLVETSFRQLDFDAARRYASMVYGFVSRADLSLESEKIQKLHVDMIENMFPNHCSCSINAKIDQPDPTAETTAIRRSSSSSMVAVKKAARLEGSNPNVFSTTDEMKRERERLIRRCLQWCREQLESMTSLPQWMLLYSPGSFVHKDWMLVFCAFWKRWYKHGEFNPAAPDALRMERVIGISNAELLAVMTSTIMKFVLPPLQYSERDLIAQTRCAAKYLTDISDEVLTSEVMSTLTSRKHLLVSVNTIPRVIAYGIIRRLAQSGLNMRFRNPSLAVRSKSKKTDERGLHVAEYNYNPVLCPSLRPSDTSSFQKLAIRIKQNGITVRQSPPSNLTSLGKVSAGSGDWVKSALKFDELLEHVGTLNV